MTLIEKAIRFAVRAHEGQKRKEDPSLPYIVHPIAVALRLQKYNFSEIVVAAGLVHDVIEDTSVTREELQKELGSDVLAVVEFLTTDEDKTLPWEERKQQYIDWVRKGPFEVKAVAAAEKAHNLESMLAGEAEEGPDFWKHFTRGRKEQVWLAKTFLQMLRETWQHPLVDDYARLVEAFERVA